MISALGESLLEFCALIAIVQFLLIFAHKFPRLQTSHMPSCAIGGAIAMVVTFAVLIYGFVVSDFSLQLVFAHSHTQSPLLYKVTATWGNHEGSMLLWCVILALYTAHMAFRLSKSELRLKAIAIMGLIQALFIIYLRITSNPFEPMFPRGFEGEGFNPLLQDFGLAIHPPILYAGYVGLAAPFVLAIAALLSPVAATHNLARLLHPYLMFAWAALTAGIALGSWWAYRELGWGGWWFWDPVENVALLPWFATTALFHANLILRKSGNMPRFVLLLCIMCFALSLIGTFLVRSGLLSSVHSFASDPTRGLAICAIMVVIISLGAYSYMRGARHLPAITPLKLFSKQSAILLNNWLLLLTMAMIFLATFYPFIIEATTGRTITIGADYFTPIFVWLMLPLVAACALSNYLVWSDLPNKKLSQKSAIVAVESLLSAGLGCYFLPSPSLMLFLGLLVGIWLLIATIKSAVNLGRARQLSSGKYAMLLAHAALAIFTLSVTLFGSYHDEAEFIMQQGEVRQVFNGAELSLINVEFGKRDNYLWQRANVQLLQDGAEIIFKPEERFYPTEQQFTTEASINHFLTHDVYVTLKRVNQKTTNTEISGQKYIIHIYYNPAMWFLWISCAMMVVAGLIAAYNGAVNQQKSKDKLKS